MKIPSGLRDRIQAYLDEDVTLREFEDSFVKEFWSDKYYYRTLDVVFEIELGIAEYRGGSRTHEQLNHLFELLLQVDAANDRSM